ncbi:MAG: hypothetical protein JWO83_456 [Caulobacteraceae bacterium]|nr:hypothetical protein [Caulobacteraceae bacterium]
MQASVLAVGLLVYAGAALDAWEVLPGGDDLRWKLTIVFPGAYLALTLVVALAIPAVRRAITRHLWLSYRTGFGQSVISVIVGLGLLVALAGLIVWQVHRLAHGGGSPGGAFAGFGAGLGLLIAQVVLVRALEADPAVRDLIGRRDEA